MGAPTWPPTPEEADQATLAEYGDAARAVIAAESDEEAEQALLVHFLMGPVRRQRTDGVEVGLPLDAVRRPLAAWLRMVSGLQVELAVSDPACTDRQRIFLPRAVPAPERPDQDRLLYRTMALLQAGLLDLRLLHSDALLAELHADWVFRNAWHLLACRLVARMWSERFPGIARDFEGVRFLDKAAILRVNLAEVPARGLPAAFRPLVEALVDLPDAASPDPAAGPAAAAVAAIDAVDLSSEIGRKGAGLVLTGRARTLRAHFRALRLGPPPLPYVCGVLRPEWILDDLARDRSAEEEWRQGNKPLRQLLAAMKKKGRAEEGGIKDALRRRMRPGRPGTPAWEEIVTNEAPPPPTEDEGHEYDEWNHERGHYVVAAARVVEAPAPSGPLQHYERIVSAQRTEIERIRRQFAVLRVEERWVHGQPDGPELDLNRAVSAMADIRAGFTPRIDWHLRFQRQRRDLCILVLVDLSGSTRGAILHREQDALVIFAEGLKVLGLPHAFYGFEGQGPRACAMHRIKGFDDPWDDEVKKRLGNLRPGGATRLGAHIRHASWILGQQPQERRVLMVLSDGRPEDRDQYRGPYGVKDTAMAVQEAHRDGVYVHCISLDPKVAGAVAHGEGEQAEAYLVEIFGGGRYLVCDDTDDLPKRLPEVFRGLLR
ncbi:MAG: hypothetical protein H6742_06090 [Alphaproteobacteria bacterium]|nr:hypothetical protein [Alphaproteobacteria bacterium]